MLPALLLGGVAATYMHKKFPKATEAVANGIVKSAVWVVKKTAEMVTEHCSPALEIEMDTGTRLPVRKMGECCAEYFAVHTTAPSCAYCGSKRP